MSPPRAQSPDRIVRQLQAATSAVGLCLSGAWPHADTFLGHLSAGQRQLYRVDLSGGEEHSTLDIMPLNPASEHLVGHWPRLSPTDADGMEDAESFLRALAVAVKSLPLREFPSDAALARCIGAAALPSRRTDSPGGRALRFEAAHLAARYDRQAALALVAAAARQEAALDQEGRECDPEHGYAVRLARDAVSGRLSRFFAAFMTESHMGHLMLKRRATDSLTPFEPTARTPGKRAPKAPSVAHVLPDDADLAEAPSPSSGP